MLGFVSDIQRERGLYRILYRIFSQMRKFVYEKHYEVTIVLNWEMFANSEINLIKFL